MENKSEPTFSIERVLKEQKDLYELITPDMVLVEQPEL